MERISLRTLISGLLLAIVLLAVIHTAVSQYQFRRAALDYRTDSMARVIEVAAHEVLRQARGHAIALGGSLQRRLHLRDGTALHAQLQEPFNKGYAEAGYLDLLAVRAYDSALTPLAAGGRANLPPLPAPFVRDLLRREGVERLKAVSTLWLANAEPFYSVVIPIGGLQVEGYLEVVIDPLFNLRQVGEMIRMPFGVHGPHGEEMLHPENVREDDPRYFAMEYALRGVADDAVLYLAAYADIDLLYQDMRRTQMITTLWFLVLTLTMLGLSFWLLNRHLFQPVHHMIGQMEDAVRDGRDTLVTRHGIKEVHIVAAAFNIMAARVRDIIQELQRISAQDGLTGIANRRSFNQALEREWLRAMRQQTPLSALLIDIDYFKQYNDHYGHQAGDECLKSIASALSLAVQRPTDMVARYGGEEFVLLLPETDRRGALLIAERLQQLINRLAIPHALSPLGQVGMSIGICTLIPQRDQPSQRLVACADRALYRAKAAGRNRIEVASADDEAAGTAVP
ncbi:diguanylate cyclase [Sulfurivermis fontis]|uniref:GGDEF domain-containing protein n=1 Tax=Sulfurivermis fontis TaxID=1972068 RepID=UPI000FD73A84|nr:diguanylate cyclase [Sulfurivermis fontis]